MHTEVGDTMIQEAMTDEELDRIEAAIVNAQGPEDRVWNRGLTADGKYFHNAPGNHCASVETEMGQKIKELVIETKPLVCVEVGTNKGYSSTWILLGIERNHLGYLVTFDNGSEISVDTLRDGVVDNFFWREFNLPEWHIQFVKSNVWDNPVQLPQEIDFCFNDSSHKKDETLHEVEVIAPRIRKNGIFCFHDVLLIGEMGVPVEAYFKSKPTEWSYEVWPYGRGLGIARKL